MKKAWLTAVSTIVIAVSLAAQIEDEWTLIRCVETALQQNLSLKAADSRYLASKAREKTATAFDQPEISFDSDWQPQPFHFKRYGESYLGLSQNLEWPMKIHLKGGIARQESMVAFHAVNERRWEIIHLVKQAFYALLLAQEKKSLSHENFELARDFLKRAQAKFELGDVPHVDVLKAKVEMARTEQDLSLVENAERLAQADLNFLLNRPPDSPIKINGTLKTTEIEIRPAEWIEQALIRRPDIKQAQAEEKRSVLNLKLARWSYLPTFQIGVAKHYLRGEKAVWDTSLTMQIPLFFWQPQKGSVTEATALKAAAIADLREKERAVRLEVERAAQNLDNSLRQVRFFEEHVLKEAQEVYHKTLLSYQEGEIGYLEVIDSRRTWVDVRNTYAESAYHYLVALSELEKTIGISLEKEEPYEN